MLSFPFYVIFLVPVFLICPCRCNKLDDLIDDQECGNAQVDMVFVVDSSGSVQNVFDTYKEAATDLVRLLSIGENRTLFTIVQFSDQASVKLEFTDTQTAEEVNKTLNDLVWLGGMTQSAEAVELGVSAYYKWGRQDAMRMFVLMTDGNSHNSWPRVNETARRLHASNARIYVMALGDSVYWPELKEYAGPNGTIVRREDFNKFKGEILDLTGYVCHPVVRYNAYSQQAETSTLAVTSELSTSTTTTSTSTTSTTTSTPTSTSTSTASSTTSTIPTTLTTTTRSTPSPTSTTTSTTTTTTTTTPTSTTPIPTSPTTTTTSSTTTWTSPTSSSTQVPSTTPSPSSTIGTSTAPPVPTLASYSNCPLDILFILDSSARDRSDFDRQIHFMLDVIDGLTIDTSAQLVGLVEHASQHRQRLQFSFTAYLRKSELVSAVSALPFFLGTPMTEDALNLGRDALRDRRPSVPALIIVLTDGFGRGRVSNLASALRSQPNTQVYAISVTAASNPNELIKIAGDSNHAYPKGNSSVIKYEILPKYLNCDSISTISETTPVTTIPITTTSTPTTTTTITSTTTTPTTTSSTTTTTSSTITSTSTTPTTTTSTTSTSTTTSTPSTSTTTSTTTPSTTATTQATTPSTIIPPTTIPPETTTPTTTTPTTTTELILTGCLLDLLFVLDSSGSVAQVFRRELEFASSIVDRLIVGPRNARVSAIKYAGAGKTKVVFPFAKYTTADDVKNGILSTTFISGTTATNEALQIAAKEYESINGARPGRARFLVIVFTDGFSQDDPDEGAKALRDKGATVFAIGINKVHPVNKEELVEIAGDEARVFTDDTIDSLYNALDQLEQSCKQQSPPIDQLFNTGPASPATQSESTSETVYSATQPPRAQSESTPEIGYPATQPPQARGRYPPGLFDRP